MALSSVVIETTPFGDQKPGTSGLRKKVKVFMEKNYTENFVQSIFNALGDKVKGSTLVVGGDGRYFSKQAINTIIRIASANEVSKLIIGQLGLLSTPAVSGLIRSHKVLGGIVLTASHNPGGIRHDFGIKYNIENGGPATDAVADDIYEHTKRITQYKTTPKLETDRLIDVLGTTKFDVEGREFVVEIIDPTVDYVNLMKEIFDFPKLRTLIRGSDTRPPFNILMDSMNGVTGVYVRHIFVEELGASPDHNVCRIVPLDNFGEIHPDPNLTYAKDLVDKVKANPSYDLGAAFDGDGDRNMIIGKNAFFVTPSDSLAVIANNLDCIPYFKKNGVHGFARSMPTGAAVDRVAKKLGKEMFEVPTGWKYFGNLMDAGRLSLCGEESFGTGSDHIREKDGIWAVLAWLSIIEHKKMSVEDILKEHWKLYGRNYFTRYDYEECESDAACNMMNHIESKMSSDCFVGKSYCAAGKTYTIDKADNFSYVDPIDNSVAKNQGVRILFTDGSRLIYRLSGTGSSGATIRVYIECYEKDNVLADAQDKLKKTTVFGAGLLVGTALTVIIPEGVRSLIPEEIPHQAQNKSEVHEHKDPLSVIGISLVLGFIFMLIVDQFSQSRNENVNPNERNITATIGLVVHAAADGVALGAAATTSHADVEIIVFLAIMLHKAPAAFGLVTFLLHEGIERQRIRKHLLIFSLAAPVLTCLTYFGIGQKQRETLSDLNLTGIAMLFSAGTFLYVATVHVLADITQRGAQSHQYSKLPQSAQDTTKQNIPSTHSLKIVELVFLVIGCLFPLVLSAGHHH